jgi:hypothetical protein
MKKSVAIIGSFRKFYDQVLAVSDIFNEMDIPVTSPAGSDIIEPDIPFVRFTSDDTNFSDTMVQTITLKRILKASAIYVVNPDGYVGRTTCYEIGRIIQSRKPIYFSEMPTDLPINIPKSHIVHPKELAKLILKGRICWPYENITCETSFEECKLVKIVV